MRVTYCDANRYVPAAARMVTSLVYEKLFLTAIIVGLIAVGVSWLCVWLGNRVIMPAKEQVEEQKDDKD